MPKYIKHRYQFKSTGSNQVDEQDVLACSKHNFSCKVCIKICICNRIAALPPLLNCHNRVNLNGYIFLVLLCLPWCGMVLNTQTQKCKFASRKFAIVVFLLLLIWCFQSQDGEPCAEKCSYWLVFFIFLEQHQNGYCINVLSLLWLLFWVIVFNSSSVVIVFV